MFQFTNAQISLGVEGGIKLSNIKFEGLEGVDNQPSTNYFVGISPRYSINKKISINLDINYSTKGYQIGTGGNNDVSKFRYTYLILAPQFEYKLFQIFGVGAGLYTGIKIDEEQKTPGNNWNSTKEFDIIKSIDYGIILSIKAYYKNLYIKFAYDYGLQDIMNLNFTDQNGQPIEIKNYNRSVQIGIGYLFNFRTK